MLRHNVPKFIKNLLFRRKGLRFKKKIILKQNVLNYDVLLQTLWDPTTKPYGTNSKNTTFIKIVP